MNQMSDVPQGPGWWQAADLKWYPPETHPNYQAAPPPPPPPGRYAAGPAQAPGFPTGPPPQAWPSPYPSGQGPGGQVASDGLAAVKGIVGKFSATAWLVFGGLVIALIATFLPFATVTYKLFGAAVVSNDVSANGSARFAVFLFVAIGAALAWPAFSGAQVTTGRLIGLSVVVCLLVGLMLVWFSHVSSQHEGNAEVAADVSPGFGLLLYGAAVIVIAVGVIRLWVLRSQAPKQAY